MELVRGVAVAACVSIAFWMSLRANVNSWLRGYLGALLAGQVAGEAVQWPGGDTSSDVYAQTYAVCVAITLGTIVAIVLPWNATKPAWSQALTTILAVMAGTILYFSLAQRYADTFAALDPSWPFRARVIVLQYAVLFACGLITLTSPPFLYLRDHPAYHRQGRIAQVLGPLWMAQSLVGVLGVHVTMSNPPIGASLMAWLPAITVCVGMLALAWMLKPKF